MSRRADQDMDEDEGGSKRAGSPLDVRRLVRVVWRAKTWVVGAALVGLVIGVLVAKFGIGRSYLTSAVVRYEGLPGQSFLEAQQDLPSLASVALTDRFVLEMRERAGLEAVHVDAMRAILQVSADQGTRQVSFNAYGESPEQAANLANDAVELFLQHHTELREAALRSEQASVAERISATSIELNDARTAYDTFRSEHGISEMNVEQSQVIAQAAELRTEATLAGAEVEAARARVRQLTASIEEAPRSRGTTGGATNASRRIEDARVAELRQRLREARGQGLGDSHPQVQSLQRQVAALERQQREGATEDPTGMVRSSGGSSALVQERRANLETAQTELETLESRHATLEQLATAAEERGNRFSDIESQAASLLAQVNVKGALVESLTERAANIDDQLHDIPTGFRSVSNAIPPENAVPSKKKKLIALGVPLVFGLLALLVVVARDLNGLRLIAPPEIAWWGEGPVVATSSWPRNSEAFEDLLADLEELMRDKRGELLLVGATEVERQLAETLTMVIRQTWRGVVQDEHEAVMSPARSAQGGATSSLGSTTSSSGEPERHVIGNVLPMGRRTRNSPPGGFAAVQSDDTGGIRISHALRVSTCTWDGQRGVAALRRAARRSDGVMVLVGAGIKASELRRVRRELALDGGVAFVLLAVSDAVARQNDRAGHVGDFLSGFAG
jgi:uncharacterized protein involved in exopolysaccharide biosynthesis